MKFTKVITLMLVICPLASIAQKIKYDDLYKLLNSGAYVEAEPQLKLFMADPKNADHPNATYQMGAIIEKRFYETDILSDTSLIASRGDSAIAFFKNAISLITEKEIKKNDELYQNFHRRDLRTGEFGIKISDVHLDLEKKIENIDKRTNALRNFRGMLLRINGRNKLSATLYKQLVDKAPAYKQLLFSFTEEDLASLDRIRDNAQGLYTLINEMKAAAKELGSDYYQSFKDFNLIEKYGVDGLTQQNMFDGQLELWDYETWASATRNDYFTVKQYLINLMKKEEELLDAKSQLDQGVIPDQVSLAEIKAEAAKQDAEGIAVQLLELKSERLEFDKAISPSSSGANTDSTNVYARFQMARIISDRLAIIKGVYDKASDGEKVSLAKSRYPKLIEQYYGGPAGLDTYVKNYGAWLGTQTLKWQLAIKSLADREQYAITGADSIPLFSGGTSKKYLILQAAGEESKVAAGLEFKPKTAEGLIAWSGPARDISARKTFKVGAPNPSAKSGIVPSNHFAFYVFNPDVAANNLAIVSTNENQDIKWANLITAPNEPVSFRYDATLDQVTVFYYPEDQLPGDGKIAYVVIDRNGTVR